MTLASCLRKPAASAVSRYDPGARLRNRKLPAASDVVVAETRVARLTASTAAFGIAAPLESCTMPVTLPVYWAEAALHVTSTRSSEQPTLPHSRILPPAHCGLRIDYRWSIGASRNEHFRHRERSRRRVRRTLSPNAGDCQADRRLQPLFATTPAPSRTVISWLAATRVILSCCPLGQSISTSATAAAPRPKCRRGSLQE